MEICLTNLDFELLFVFALRDTHEGKKCCLCQLGCLYVFYFNYVEEDDDVVNVTMVFSCCPSSG